MPDQEPFIVPSTDPFKVEATPAKFGGVDARAKRPLDMSGKGVALTDHLETVTAPPSAEGGAVLLPVEQQVPGSTVSVAMPESTIDQASRAGIPGREPMVDSHALLPDEVDRAQGLEDTQGPLVQDALDTRHREQFDDPSRFLRTDTRVRLPSPRPLRRHQTVPTLLRDPSGRILMPVASPVDADSGPALSDRSISAMPSAARMGDAAQAVRPEGSRLAKSIAALSGSSASEGTSEQRRQSFNERLTQILSDQAQITSDLSAVEQAAQLTRAQIHDQPPDEPPQAD